MRVIEDLSFYSYYQYRAWHLEDEMWVLRKSIAKRRYREFVTLHDRLEEHPIYKKKIKGKSKVGRDRETWTVKFNPL